MDKENIPEQLVFGLDIGTRSIVGTVGYKQSVNNFVVVAQSVRCHETRAMMDGQIHDIAKVAETISQVRRELEHQIGRKLNRVCIAAAGRVLKTVTVEVEENLGDENFQDEMISAEIIHGLEMLGVEKAYEIIRKETQGENIRFYCVGYSVVHYYLNDNMITNLEGHKGNKIAAKVLATFLPQEVIDGLYASTEKAGLEVDNLTLEPIAAINVAIPEKFRLLNIALVDVGAGTSDICITKEGTVVAYGMIPMAGDAITNVIVQAHLVDFATAEEIKIGASMQKKVINYKDIMGLAEKTTPEEVFAETQDKVAEITQLVADKIVELNGGKSVSAVFVVGGGGKLPDFVKMLANRLNLPEERVALRGEEVLGAITFPEDVKKDPMLVTPIGICLNYYEQKNNFIFVQVNGERVKLYDNSKLTIVDAALSVGFPNDGLFPKRGMALEFFVNERKRMVRGGEGEAAGGGLLYPFGGVHSLLGLLGQRPGRGQRSGLVLCTRPLSGGDGQPETVEGRAAGRSLFYCRLCAHVSLGFCAASGDRGLAVCDTAAHGSRILLGYFCTVCRNVLWKTQAGASTLPQEDGGRGHRWGGGRPGLRHALRPDFSVFCAGGHTFLSCVGVIRLFGEHYLPAWGLVLFLYQEGVWY